jgi:hypothetical protein
MVQRYNEIIVAVIWSAPTLRGLAKFDQMVADGLLKVVFKNEGTTIYEVVR